MARGRESLIVAGWSVRAAAQSARRGGFAVAACDVFQDADLTAVADECRRVRSLRELATVAAEFPPGDWLYTGGVECRPAVVAAMVKRHRLLGNDAAVLRRVREPRFLQRILADGPAPLPETRWTEPAAGDDRRWLVKCRNSGGGVRVRPYLAGRSLPRGSYLQEFVSGKSFGVSYLAADGRCLLLGVCRQLHAAVDPARPFLYGGSLGPIALQSGAQQKLVQLGERLTAEFSLRGLFGVDAILQPDGSLRTLEVNPRYTASMELLERAAGRSVVEMHVRACREGRLPESFSTSSELYGKQIVYVDESIPSVVSPSLAAALLSAAGGAEYPQLADVPAAGTRLRRGEPCCTVFAAGATANEVERGLAEQVRRLHELIKFQSAAEDDSASSRSALRRRRAASSGS